MRTVKWSIGGTDYVMAYTMDAMLELQEEEPDLNELIRKMAQNSREGYALLVKAVAVLTREGELARRAVGMDHREIPEEETIRRMIAPKDQAMLMGAVMSAIERGMLTEIENDEVVDMILLELEKKTEIRVQEPKPTA